MLLQKYMQKLLGKSYNDLQWKDVEDEDIMRRLRNTFYFLSQKIHDTMKILTIV